VGRNDPDRWLPEAGQSTGFSVLVRSLLKSERPSGLTQAIIEVGRINKTLYLLNYIDDEDYRRRILTQLNRGESRHAVARAICHGQKVR
jgi:TnpA family transposase